MFFFFQSYIIIIVSITYRSTFGDTASICYRTVAHNIVIYQPISRFSFSFSLLTRFYIDHTDTCALTPIRIPSKQVIDLRSVSFFLSKLRRSRLKVTVSVLVTRGVFLKRLKSLRFSVKRRKIAIVLKNQCV